MALPLPSFALPLSLRALFLTLCSRAASSLPIAAAYRHFRYKSCSFIALPHSHIHTCTRTHTIRLELVSICYCYCLRVVAFAFSLRPLAQIEVMSLRM